MILAAIHLKMHILITEVYLKIRFHHISLLFCLITKLMDVRAGAVID